ncbi:MAG: hypothetical protein ACXWMU_02635 [Candidatus Limnocylindrales bacterium]
MAQVDGTDRSEHQQTARRLASEIEEVGSAIELVRSGAASRVILTGLRFADAVIDRFGAEARREGVELDPEYWPEDAGCDVVVRRADVEA